MRWGRRLLTWKRIRRVLMLLVWGVTAVALFYAEENWRGRRAWERYRRQLEAQGERMDIKALIPKPVPDGQNFAQTPALVPLFDFEPGTQQARDTNGFARLQKDPPRFQAASGAMESDEQRRGDWTRGIGIDLAAWQQAYTTSAARAARTGESQAQAILDRPSAAREVLQELSEFDSLLNELRTASDRPYSRFNIRYEEENAAAVLLPHLGVMNRMVRILQLRASAELALDQSAAATDDLVFALRLTDAVKDEPILISCLVRMNELNLVLQALWEGIADQKFSEAQLAELQQRLSGFDFLAETRRGMEADRAALGNGVFDFVRRWPSQRASVVGVLDEFGDQVGIVPLESLALRLSPAGWIYLEQLQYNHIFQDQILPMVDVPTRRVLPDAVAAHQAALDRLFTGKWYELFWHHRMFSRVLLPALAVVPARGARAQSSVDLAVVACAIERSRLAKGHYPTTLNELVPEFIARVPRDVIDGQPLRYHLADNRYVLYSIGWNQKDDGGEYPPKATRDRRLLRGIAPGETASGDWVWRFPAKTAAMATVQAGRVVSPNR